MLQEMPLTILRRTLSPVRETDFASHHRQTEQTFHLLVQATKYQLKRKYEKKVKQNNLQNENITK